ncbi:MAG: glutamate--tRNA ligase [Thermoplasmata archaeon]|nr:glutamate--tRNA ligase [Thermoplasmata archaeon]
MRDKVLAYALQNAREHGGKAGIGPVMGKVMASIPELRSDPKAASTLVREVVDQVNSMDAADQKVELDRLGEPETIKRKRKDTLDELENVPKDGIVVRFAPGPSGPLHIGHSRASILNDEYVKRYGGKFILRLEDTNPEKIDPEAYNMIPEDLSWLGVKVHETFVQSDRFEMYYDVARSLIESGSGYTCTCDPEHWRERKLEGKPCPHRGDVVEDQLERWDGMFDGTFSAGEASMMVKTDLEHPNPAVRDFVGMRIKDVAHPRTGDRYRVYPLYNLAVAIDDHLMSCTHVLRGKDHLNNTFRQEFVYRHMGWGLPAFIHYGLVSIPNTILKTSIIREEMSRGNYTGWDDIRLGTLRALSGRGFMPEALRKYWYKVGIKSVDVTFSWENFNAMNKELIDDGTDRLYFVADPVELAISTDIPLSGRSPLHPDHRERGYREYEHTPHDGIVRLSVPREEIATLKVGGVVRLKDLCSVRIRTKEPLTGEREDLSVSDVRRGGGSIIQWVSSSGVQCKVLFPDGQVQEGRAEEGVKGRARKGQMVQFERFGFFKLSEEDGIVGRFAHK